MFFNSKKFENTRIFFFIKKFSFNKKKFYANRKLFLIWKIFENQSKKRISKKIWKSGKKIIFQTFLQRLRIISPSKTSIFHHILSSILRPSHWNCNVFSCVPLEKITIYERVRPDFPDSGESGFRSIVLKVFFFSTSYSSENTISEPEIVWDWPKISQNTH